MERGRHCPQRQQRRSCGGEPERSGAEAAVLGPRRGTTSSALLLRVLPLLALVSLAAPLASAQGPPYSLKLGFLMPLPADDYAIPRALADEWMTAAKVALEVLTPKYQLSFMVDPVFQDSKCSREDAKNAAEALVQQGVVGVVGPACSEAAVGAAPVLGRAGIPLISFAATTDQLMDRSAFPTFFRTSFGDRQQSAAIQAVIEYFGFSQVVVFYSDEAYGRALGFDIIKRAKSSGVNVVPIRVSYPPPEDLSIFFFDQSQGAGQGTLLDPNPDSIIVLAVMPQVAKGLWKAAKSLNLMKFPWWYLGSDGAVAFDLVGDDPGLSELASAMQGELGMAPWKGDYGEGSPLIEFLDYWKTLPYDLFPGLLNLPVQPPLNFTRPYVPFLFDAIVSFFQAFNHIINAQGSAPDKDTVLKCLTGDLLQACVEFSGCTGTVAFNRHTGERAKVDTVASFDFVNLDGIAWQPKATWWAQNNANFKATIQTVTRPGQIPKDAHSPKAVDAPKYTAPSSYFHMPSYGPVTAEVTGPPPPSIPESDFLPPDYPTEDSSGADREWWYIAIIVVLSLLLLLLLLYLARLALSSKLGTYQRMNSHDMPHFQAMLYAGAASLAAAASGGKEGRAALGSADSLSRTDSESRQEGGGEARQDTAVGHTKTDARSATEADGPFQTVEIGALSPPLGLGGESTPPREASPSSPSLFSVSLSPELPSSVPPGELLVNLSHEPGFVTKQLPFTSVVSADPFVGSPSPTHLHNL